MGARGGRLDVGEASCTLGARESGSSGGRTEKSSLPALT